MKRFLATVALFLLLPLSAHAWWDKDWTGRKKITLDTKAAGITMDTAQVPLLVRLSSANFDFLAGKEDGSDLRFLAEDDKTVLPFQIERFDSVNNLAFVWVQVPKLQAANITQHIWMYYGNTKAPAAAPTLAFDAQQLAVFHFGETQGLPQDASGKGLHATESHATPVPSGLIAGSAHMNGDGGLVVSNPILQQTKEITVSAWINAESGEGEVFSFGGMSLTLAAGVPTLKMGGTSYKAAEALSLNVWHHVAVTGGAQAVLFVDGKAVANAAGLLVAGSELRVGAGLVGKIDEIQVSGMARPEAWLAAQVQSQSEQGMLLVQGEEQTTDTSEGPNYFKATLQNLTVDGWVVVGICVVMFFIAIWVMGKKLLLLNNMERTNRSFAEEFAKVTRGLLELGEDAKAHSHALESLSLRVKEFTGSSLHRIYTVGVAELRSRFPAVADGHHAFPVISDQSINAVRATLDAQLTRERHGLDKGMVLLTIAISGGPFLGLLGTVVGVMITFAAIAAAGDVNVNAIAPGIAAALVATVAGLGVAIPALFGYNYLQTRIKGVGADMHVFVDEFVTKMAENYGG
jgi:biopolymer transport protein ExbB